MITNKTDLLEYLEADKKALNRKTNKPQKYDWIWKYQIALRKLEYYTNVSQSFWTKLNKKYYLYKVENYKRTLNFSIPINVCERGLSIAHVGPIIINDRAKIGKNCRIHVGVNIGAAAGKPEEVPVVGDNVYIGPGAKLFGGIRIADGVAIGANSVINKDILEENITVAGVPGKKTSDKGSEGLLVKAAK